MQSFRQYQRFAKRIHAQYERDKEKVVASCRPRNHLSQSPADGLPSSSPSSSSSSSSSIEQGVDSEDLQNEVSRDPEKAVASIEPPPHQEHEPGFESRERGRSPPVDPMERQPTLTTRRSMSTNLGLALTGVELRTTSNQLGKVLVVGYEGEDDDMNPHNWSRWVRAQATILIACIGFVVGVASSIDSAVLKQASAEFGVSDFSEALATGIFLIGFGVGALFAGPFSETVGRNPVYIETLTVYMIWIMASGLAPNIGAQLVFRFLAGFFGSTPLVCAGGSISDLWSPMERVYAFPVFANAAFMGPVVGPIIGGFIGQSSRLSWRWTEWITLIMSGLVLILVVLFQPETFAPILLKWKAAHLRELSSDPRYRAEIEIRDESFLHRLQRALYRPFVLTFSEPIILLLAVYLMVIYIILFTFLDGYNYIFTETHRFSQGLTGLSFAGIAIGLCLSSCLVPVIHHWAQNDLKKVKEQGGQRLPPEFRLWFAIFGAPAIPIALFWMGWTTSESISPWSPLAASVLFGYGILTVFISSYQYIIDSYETYSASALASVTLIRYVAAGGMVEAAIPMYENLGVHWTCTILGCISALMVPVPYAFYKWGHRIRARSKYAIV